MAINKRELELSQSLMDLQSQYNAIVTENKMLKATCISLRANSVEATKRIEGLLASVSVLKSTQKKVVSSVAKVKKTETK